MTASARLQDEPIVHIEGLYAPVMDEVTATDLTVIGEIPRDLNGLFAQNGANPRFHPTGPGYSWFDGDGMVQGVHLDNGKATFRSRWVKTAGLAEDIAAGRATYIGSNAKPGTRGKRHKNVANTDLVYHGGRLLALWWEGGEPHQLSPTDLETIGVFNYNNTLTRGLTSTPRSTPRPANSSSSLGAYSGRSCRSASRTRLAASHIRSRSICQARACSTTWA